MNIDINTGHDALVIPTQEESPGAAAPASPAHPRLPTFAVQIH
jgi:hypothetical protein